MAVCGHWSDYSEVSSVCGNGVSSTFSALQTSPWKGDCIYLWLAQLQTHYKSLSGCGLGKLTKGSMY